MAEKTTSLWLAETGTIYFIFLIALQCKLMLARLQFSQWYNKWVIVWKLKQITFFVIYLYCNIFWKNFQISLVGPVHTTPEKFENEVLTLKTHQMCFPSTLRRRNWETQQSPVILDLWLRSTRAGKSHDYRNVIVFEKFRFQNVFRPQKETQNQRFHSARCEECSRLAAISWRISVDCRK